jgi:hypothetical protein
MDNQGNAVEAEDFQDDYYCVHGTFVGNPHGGDYMCGDCEMGVTREEYLIGQILEGNRRRRRNTAMAYIQHCPSDFKYDFYPYAGAMIMAILRSLYNPKF